MASAATLDVVSPNTLLAPRSSFQPLADLVVVHDVMSDKFSALEDEDDPAVQPEAHLIRPAPELSETDPGMEVRLSEPLLSGGNCGVDLCDFGLAQPAGGLEQAGANPHSNHRGSLPLNSANRPALRSA